MLATNNGAGGADISLHGERILETNYSVYRYVTPSPSLSCYSLTMTVMMMIMMMMNTLT